VTPVRWRIAATCGAILALHDETTIPMSVFRSADEALWPYVIYQEFWILASPPSVWVSDICIVRGTAACAGIKNDLPLQRRNVAWWSLANGSKFVALTLRGRGAVRS
jgi:hypothetical protein